MPPEAAPLAANIPPIFLLLVILIGAMFAATGLCFRFAKANEYGPSGVAGVIAVAAGIAVMVTAIRLLVILTHWTG